MNESKPNMALQFFYEAEQLYNNGEFEVALKSLNKALKLDEKNVRGWIFTARLADECNATEIEYIALEKAVELSEFWILPPYIKITVLKKLASIYGNINKLDKFIEAQRILSELLVNSGEKYSVYSSYLYAIQAAQINSDDEIFMANYNYNKLFANIKSFKHHNLKYTKGNRIRIGYISSDFCQHPVAFFLIKLLYFHNKNRFEITCYSGGKRVDKVTEQIKSLSEHWRDISDLSAEEAAKLIYDEEIDVLFDLGGHNVGSLLPVLAYKPAPIQMSGIGYIGTTGLKTVDYFLTDKYCDSYLHSEIDFTEKLLFLTHSHFCYSMREDIKPLAGAAFEKKGYITFGIFNRIEKITDKMLKLWSAILKRIPNSRLLFKSGFVSNDFYCKMMYWRLDNVGFNRNSVIFEEASKDYLDRYLDIDIALDTFPCCGGTTTCDALIMGVPVISMVGDRHVARFGYSILKNIGLDECIAFSEEEYIKKAVNLALDKEKLSFLHLHLREIMIKSPLMNGKLYADEIEIIYENIVRQRE